MINTSYKYIWLVRTILDAGKITFEDINQKWMDNDISEGVELSKRTFHKWRCAAEEIFSINIECTDNRPYYYSISGKLTNNAMLRWLEQSASVSSMLTNYRDVSDRIILEDVPCSNETLAKVLSALRSQTILTIEYQGFTKDKSFTFDVEPLGLKMFRQRWYLIAYNDYYDKVMVYSLDRIKHAENTSSKVSYDEDFDLEEYLANCYGVIANDGTPLEKVRLKVTGNQTNYFRTLPLHSTQNEIETHDTYSIFEYNIYPTFDFQKDILSYGANVEVLSPQWLRELIRDRIKEMNEIYE